MKSASLKKHQARAHQAVSKGFLLAHCDRCPACGVTKRDTSAIAAHLNSSRCGTQAPVTELPPALKPIESVARERILHFLVSVYDFSIALLAFQFWRLCDENTSTLSLEYRTLVPSNRTYVEDAQRGMHADARRATKVIKAQASGSSTSKPNRRTKQTKVQAEPQTDVPVPPSAPAAASEPIEPAQDAFSAPDVDATPATMGHWRTRVAKLKAVPETAVHEKFRVSIECKQVYSDVNDGAIHWLEFYDVKPVYSDQSPPVLPLGLAAPADAPWTSMLNVVAGDSPGNGQALGVPDEGTQHGLGVLEPDAMQPDQLFFGTARPIFQAARGSYAGNIVQAMDRICFLQECFPCLFPQELKAAYHVEKRQVTTRRSTVAGFIRQQYAKLTASQIQDLRDSDQPSSLPAEAPVRAVRPKRAPKRRSENNTRDIRSFFQNIGSNHSNLVGGTEASQASHDNS